MGWNYDKEPLEYLKQRVRYHEKKIKLIDKLLLDPNIVKRHGVDKIMDASEHHYFRLRQFKDAVIKLQS